MGHPLLAHQRTPHQLDAESGTPAATTLDSRLHVQYTSISRSERRTTHHLCTIPTSTLWNFLAQPHEAPLSLSALVSPKSLPPVASTGALTTCHIAGGDTDCDTLRRRTDDFRKEVLQIYAQHMGCLCVQTRLVSSPGKPRPPRPGTPWSVASSAHLIAQLFRVD